MRYLTNLLNQAYSDMLDVLLFPSIIKSPTRDDMIVKISLVIPATELFAISYVSIHALIGNAKIRDSLGFPMKKLMIERQDAINVNRENAFFHVNTLHTIDTAMKSGSQSILFAQRLLRFTNTTSRHAPIAAIAAPEYAPKNK